MKPVIITALSLGLAASQTMAATSVEPIVVSAKRFATSIDTAPVNITTITAQQIENSNATHLSQVLEMQAGVYIKDLFGITGSKSSADLGGFGASGGHNTLILINGRRQNDVDLTGANLAVIPLNSIAKIEIIHGSSAVLYGDNAVSGVINIVTKSGYEQDQGMASISGGSFSTKGIDASYSKSIDNTAFFIAADVVQSDGYRDESEFDQKSLVTEISQSSDDWNYGARLNSFDEELQLPGELNEPVFETTPTAASSSNQKAEQKRNGIDMFISGDTFAGELAYSDKNQEAVIFGTTEADLNTLSFTPRFKHEISNHQLIAGIDLYMSELDTKADFGVPNINQSNTSRDSYAIYVTDNYQLTQASSITAGLRRQWVDLEIENTNLSSATKTNTQQDDAVSAWEIGLNHQFSNSVQAYARWSDSFRFAVLDEMWSYFFGNVSLLKPQTGHHVETGAAIALSDESRLDINLFKMTLVNEIGFDNATFSNINLDPTEHQGANLNYHNQIHELWQIALGYAYRDASFRSGANKDKVIPEIPKHRLTWSNSFKLDDNNHVNLDAVYTGKRYFGDDFANVGKQMPAHTLVNLGYTYKLKNWKAQVRIDNVADKNVADQGFYRSFSSNPYFYYPLPGRAYYLTLGAEF